MDIVKKFGEKVRLLRLGMNLSQEKLAEKIGIHRTYLGMIERGEKNITLSNMHKISLTFKMSLSELLKGIDDG